MVDAGEYICTNCRATYETNRESCPACASVTLARVDAPVAVDRDSLPLAYECSGCGTQFATNDPPCPGCDALEFGPVVTDETPTADTTPDADRDLSVPGPTPWYKRRAVLGGVGAVGAVVVGGGFLLATRTPHRNAGGDAWLDRRQQASFAARGFGGTVELEEGEWVGRTLTFKQGLVVAIRVETRDRSPIDIWTLNERDIETYRSREEFAEIENLSRTGVRNGEISATLPVGDYAFIWDNTAVYGSEPDGDVVADVALAYGVR